MKSLNCIHVLNVRNSKIFRAHGLHVATMSLHIQESDCSCTHVSIIIASGRGVKVQVTSCSQCPAAVVELKVSIYISYLPVYTTLCI